MDDLKKKVEALEEEILETFQRLKLNKLEDELYDLRLQMSKPDFWSNRQNAQELSQREAIIAKRLQPWQKLQKNISETKELVKLKDDSMLDELQRQVINLAQDFEDLKKQLRFQGPYDDHDVILGLYAGAGGTDAQDWTQMLLRMYVRWAEKHSFVATVIDQTAGEEAGLKSATIQISGGEFLYGKLLGEHGVHRLVRQSPYNAGNLRQTSFAKVEVLPKIDRPDELKIDEKDLKVEVFRAGGHGGQSVNTTDSAVRVTHIPTGISVAIQNERSQLQNKETALSVLRSRLVSLQMQQHVKTLQELKGSSQSAEWGNQIRNYVLHPYKQVKDLRTGFESSDVEKVLDGHLDPLVGAWVSRL